MSDAAAETARAEALLEANQPAAAIGILSSVVGGGDADARTYCVLGLAHLQTDRPGLALEAGRSALHLDATSEWALRIVSVAQEKLYNLPEAVASAERAVEVAPWSWAAHMRLSDASRAAGRHIHALEAAREAVRLAPDQAQAHLSLALAHNALGEYDEAADGYRAALRLDPDNTTSMNNLAVLGMRRRNFGRSASAFVGVLRTDPQHRIALRNLAVTAHQALRILCLGLWALTIAGRAAAKHPDDTGALALISVIAVLAMLSFVGWIAWQAGRAFGTFVKAIPRHDKLLASAFGFTLIALGMIIAAPLLPADAVRGWFGFVVAAVGAAFVLSWIWRSQGAKRRDPWD